MDSAQRQFFLSNGYLQLPGFHSRARLARLRQAVLDEVRKASGASKSLDRLPVFQQISRLSAHVKVRDVHETLMTRELIDLAADVSGQSSFIIQQTQLLLSPPRQGTWTLRGLNWHVDVAADSGRRDRIPGVQAFFLIDDVGPHGGGTLALARSHNLGADSAARLRYVLRTHDDPEHEFRKLGVRLVEMCGRAGDIFLMDMRVLHTPSINSSNQLRMMATCRCLVGD